MKLSMKSLAALLMMLNGAVMASENVNTPENRQCSVFCVVFHSRRGAETNAGRNPALRYTRHTAGHGEQ